MKGKTIMHKKLTVGELRASLEGVPEDLVVEFTSDTEEAEISSWNMPAV